MARMLLRSILLSGLLAALGLADSCATAYDGYRPLTEQSQPDVFYNFYVPGSAGAPAAMYPAPFPVPAMVGHSYYTYQPLMPHEFLYKHHRTYHQYYNAGLGLNRTSVRWYGTPVVTALKSLRQAVKIPR